jgi:hypothetical protein
MTNPEPKPSRTKLNSMKQLRQAVRAHCVAWWTWRHGEIPQLARLQVVKGARHLYAAGTAPEERAQKELYRLRAALKAAVALVDGAPGGSGRSAFGVLLDNRDVLVALLRQLEIKAPAPDRPSRRGWLESGTCYDASAPAEHLAVYSLLAGWWPESVKVGDEDEGASVATVLDAEKKLILAALQGFRK